MGAKDELVYAPRHADLYIEHPLARGGTRQSICIHYYISVSSVLGPILFLPVTGVTQFLKLGGKAYKVRGLLCLLCQVRLHFVYGPLQQASPSACHVAGHC